MASDPSAEDVAPPVADPAPVPVEPRQTTVDALDLTSWGDDSAPSLPSVDDAEMRVSGVVVAMLSAMS